MNTVLEPSPIKTSELEHLAVQLEYSSTGSLTFCVYHTLYDIKEVQTVLEKRWKTTILQFILDKQQLNPLQPVLDLPPEPKQTVFIVYRGNLQEELTQAAGYANVQREILNTIPHNVVLWFGEEAFARFVRQSPDFWAWHSGYYEFSSEQPDMMGLYQQFIKIDEIFPEQPSNNDYLKKRVQALNVIVESSSAITQKDLKYLARIYFRLAESQHDLGNYELALLDIQKAIELAQQLADKHLISQCQVSIVKNLHSLGRLEETQKAIFVAAKMLRQLTQVVQKRSNVYKQALAVSLVVLAEYDEKNSIDLLLEAIDVFRQLAKKNPNVIKIDLASALNNLGIKYSESKKHNNAIKAIREAVKIYRKLIKKDSFNFISNLSSSLSSLSNEYYLLGNTKKAIEINLEAVEKYRQLVKEGYKEFKTKLSANLGLLSIKYESINKTEQAIEIIQESIILCKELALETPNTYNPALATMLNIYSTLLYKFGDVKNAYLNSKEALVKYNWGTLQEFSSDSAEMRIAIDYHLIICKHLNLEPDQALISPILAKIAELEASKVAP